MTVIIDNTGFNVEHWTRFSEAEFIEQGMKQGIFKDRPEDVRTELLKHVYQIIHNDPS